MGSEWENSFGMAKKTYQNSIWFFRIQTSSINTISKIATVCLALLKLFLTQYSKFLNKAFSNLTASKKEATKKSESKNERKKEKIEVKIVKQNSWQLKKSLRKCKKSILPKNRKSIFPYTFMNKFTYLQKSELISLLNKVDIFMWKLKPLFKIILNSFWIVNDYQLFPVI